MGQSPHTGGQRPGVWQILNRLPLWVKIVAPIVAVLLLIGAFLGGDDAGRAAGTSATPTPVAEASSPTPLPTPLPTPPPEPTPPPGLTLSEWYTMYAQPVSLVAATADGLVTHILSGGQVQVEASCSALRNNYHDLLAGNKVPDPPDPQLAQMFSDGRDAIYNARSECAGGLFTKPDYARAAIDASMGSRLLNAVLDAAQAG